MNYFRVSAKQPVSKIERFADSTAYRLLFTQDDYHYFGGEDVSGFTLDDYLFPRLASGRIVAEKVDKLPERTIGIITEVYWAIPSYYSIGDTFAANEHAEACAAAKAKIRPIDYRMLSGTQEDGTKFGWTRASLDKRMKIKWTDPEAAGVASLQGGEDTIVKRTEIHLLRSEKKAKLKEKGWL